jgi:TetR/AcrR family tetracycline transcriptional repressor
MLAIVRGPLESPASDVAPRVRERLTRESVVDAAVALVESEGLDALSMRALSEKLSVAVTSIYWHVGNKEALLDALVDRMCASIVASAPRGGTPRQRVLSTARSVLRALETHGELVAIAHERGRLAVVFAPARRYLAVELSAAGLRGDRLADAVNAVLQYVSGYCIMMGVLDRSPEQHEVALPLWAGDAPVDRVAARRLEWGPDSVRSFEIGLEALVAGLVASAGGADG